MEFQVSASYQQAWEHDKSETCIQNQIDRHNQPNLPGWSDTVCCFQNVLIKVAPSLMLRRESLFRAGCCGWMRHARVCFLFWNILFYCWLNFLTFTYWLGYVQARKILVCVCLIFQCFSRVTKLWLHKSDSDWLLAVMVLEQHYLCFQINTYTAMSDRVA